MNLTDSLLAVAQSPALAEEFRTTFWLDGGIVYADEVFNAQGFMPLLGRMAERKLMRTLAIPSERCGFSYLPDRAGLFSECFNAAPAEDDILEDAIRLAALHDAARDVVGLGYPGALDITPVFNYFRAMNRESRNEIVKNDDKDLPKWPLYQPITGQ